LEVLVRHILQLFSRFQTLNALVKLYRHITVFGDCKNAIYLHCSCGFHCSVEYKCTTWTQHKAKFYKSWEKFLNSFGLWIPEY
jgi:hypothetical protein